MSGRLDRLNALDEATAAAELERCCAAPRWIAGMLARRPFDDAGELLRVADDVWSTLGPADWLAAFAAHPRIGATNEVSPWSRREQSGMDDAADEVRDALAEGNDRYLERFGFIFLICASGLDAEAMLAALRSRLGNDRETELRIAADEQRRITALRLRRHLEEG